MSEELRLTEGWVKLANARKWHYFRDGRSLCARWFYFGSAFEADNNQPCGSDDCTTCHRAYQKEQAHR